MFDGRSILFGLDIEDAEVEVSFPVAVPRRPLTVQLECADEVRSRQILVNPSPPPGHLETAARNQISYQLHRQPVRDRPPVVRLVQRCRDARGGPFSDAVTLRRTGNRVPQLHLHTTLRQLVAQVTRLEVMLGSDEKGPVADEQKALENLRGKMLEVDFD